MESDEILMRVEKCPKCKGSCKEINTNRDPMSYGSAGESWRNCSNCSSVGVAFGYLLDGRVFSLSPEEMDRWDELHNKEVSVNSSQS